MKFTVENKGELLSFLFEKMPEKSRTTVKSYLTHRQVSVNDCVTTLNSLRLEPGDVVSISREKGIEAFRHPMLRIVFEDEYIIVIDKRNGLLSIGTDKEQQRTAYYILSSYLKRQDPRNRIFVVHRLDRETSGLMVFAKSESVQETLQRSWKTLVRDRRYVAVIEGHLQEKEGVISSYLTEDRNRKVWAAKVGEGNPAVTYYSVLREGKNFSLIELKLDTGKKNQIRAHLEFKGTPIAGDKKYSAKTNPADRVCLHAYKLHITHPVSGEELNFSTRIPKLFEDIALK